MKFKQKQIQNQRIEHISPDHLIVGIDIAKEIHVARAVNFRGIELGKSLKFSNDMAGFERLMFWVKSLQKKSQKTQLIIGMEPTGHYWLLLAYWLTEKGIEVVTVNPYLVKKNKENRDNSPTKHDVKDALVIADMIKNGYYSVLHLPQGPYKDLRELMSLHEFVTKQHVSVQNQIHRWLDKWFPEYSKVFKDWTGKMSISTLKRFPSPNEIREMSEEDILKAWKKDVKRISKAHAKELIKQAKCSIASEDGMDKATWMLKLLLEQYEQLTKQIEEIKEKAIGLIADLSIYEPLIDIKGLSPLLVTSLVAEIGHIPNFQHGNQILRLAGLHLGENSSGKHKGEITITKRGRSGLRKQLFLAVLSLVRNNKEFRELHRRNVKEKGMKKINSIMKLCGKLARMMVGMMKHKTFYSPRLVFPQVERAA
ncbi:IS110 family RNA-guided transposase [Virgibacillus necropolis]|uniref:IS110 family transposase n=1 Tax=Virgibacillus necropolis TaxID=163877 RepID=A0A221MCT9_9BACI|nr:IS110 family transposase [Virgibacillus necropolis]ASN05454.1 IS110 family transposase [Virgibacillus necropolis]ASN06987.1 IS110 family transposase [Virgibacillus necropolis]